MRFTERFKKYACIGDSISVEIGDLIYNATIQPDFDTRPEYFDCYTEEDVKRFYEGEWRYIGLVIEAEAHGKTLCDCSIWGVEINLGDDDGLYLMELANDCLSSVIEDLTLEDTVA